MKKILLLIIWLAPLMAFCQEGIYKTLQDYKDGKLTPAKGKLLFKGHKSGSKLYEDGKLIYTEDQIWGIRLFKEGAVTDYRIIDHNIHPIFVLGKICLYMNMAEYFKVNDKGDTVYVTSSNEYPFCSNTIDGEPVRVTSKKAIYKLMGISDSDETVQKCKEYDWFPNFAICYNYFHPMKEEPYLNIKNPAPHFH